MEPFPDSSLKPQWDTVKQPADHPYRAQAWATSVKEIIVGDLPFIGAVVYPETHNLSPWLLLQPSRVEHSG